MIRNQKTKKRHIAWSWLITYVLILFIPIMISLFVAGSYQRIVRSEIKRSNLTLLELTKETIDRRFNELKSTTYQLSLNHRLIRYTNTRSNLVGADRMNLYHLTEDMANYSVANEFVDNLYVYFDNNESAIGSGVSYPAFYFYDIIIKPLGYSADEWQTLLSQEHTFQLLPPHPADSNSHKALFLHSIQNYGTSSRHTFIAIIDNRQFSWPLDHSSGDSLSTTLLLIDEDKSPLLQLGDLNLSSIDYSLLETTFAEDEHTREVTINGNDIVISELQSDAVDISYLLFTPANVYWDNAQRAGVVIISGALASLVLGLSFVFLMLRRNYSPVRNLIEYLETQDLSLSEHHRNELDYIRKSVEEAIKSKNTFEYRWESQNQLLRSNVMNRLLRGDFDPDYLAQADFPSLDLAFTYESFTISVFYFDYYDDDLTLAQFILRNVFEELVSENFLCYTTNIDNLMVCVVNHPKMSSPEVERLLAPHIEKTQNVIYEYFEFIIRVHCSPPVNGIGEWSKGYYDATTSLTASLAHAKSPSFIFVKPDEITYSQIDLRRQQKLAYYLRSYDYEEARLFIEETLNPVNAFHLGTEQWRYLHTLILVTIINNIDSETQVILLQTDPFHQLNQQLYKQVDCIPYFLGLLDTVREYDPGSGLDIRAQNIVNAVEEYIESNYRDSNLNLSALGDAFELTPRYLAKLYKDVRGMALLDVLNERRVKEGKRLLLENMQLTIAEVGDYCGFTNVNSFIRVFKKYEGLPPGRFRTLSLE